MFCEKCGREIRHDSVYCSYCGKKVEIPRDEEERNEERSEFDSSEPAACIKPHMPKKHCADCGKELPGSTISNLCALCTIRRRNREEIQRRKDAKTDPKRDRYDISDEFDQSVFARRNGSDYYEPTEPRQSRDPKSKRRYNDFEEEQKDARKQRTKKVVIIAVGIFLIYFGLTTVLPYLFIQNSHAEAVSVAVESEISFEELPEFESTPESDPQGELEMEYETPRTLAELQEQCIDPVTKQILSQCVESDTVMPAQDRLTWDDAYIYAHGTVVYRQDGELKTAQYEVCMMLTEQQYLAVQAVLGDETLFDNRTYIDSKGFVTEEGAEFYEVSEGSPMFEDDPLLFPDDLENASSSDTEITII